MSAGFTDFLEQLGRTIAFHPEMARMLGSIKAALFLQQLIYWTPKAVDPYGWVFKTAEEWKEETSLTYKEQRLVRRILGVSGLGVIEERYNRLQHRLYFRVIKQALDKLWARAVDQRALREVTKGQFGDSPLGSSVLPGDDVQEKTTKTTTTTRARAAQISRPSTRSFDRFWEVIPKRISKGTAKVEAWEVWKTFKTPPTKRQVDLMVKLVKDYLQDDPTAYAFYDYEGSVKVTPAKLIGLLCRAMNEDISLMEVLDQEFDTELADLASGGSA